MIWEKENWGKIGNVIHSYVLLNWPYLFEGMYCKQNGHCFFHQTLRVKFTSLDVLTLCFNEKLPAAGNLAFIFRGQ